MLTRIITALVGIVAAVGIVTYGGFVFALAVLTLGMLAWYELQRMAANKGFHVYSITGGGGVLALLVLTGWFCINNCDRNLLFPLMIMVLVVALVAVCFEGLLRHCNWGEANWAGDVALTAFGLLYCGLLFSHVLLLRSVQGPQVHFLRAMEYGEALLWTVLIGTWASDTFAYFVGCAFGKTPFCSVSPKKSFEGGVGGFVGCFVVVLFLCIIGIGVPLWQACIIALSVAFFAPLGDLIESILKRSFEIKDSGKLFPGHGGVLDRFDSLLFTAPIVYYLLLVFSIF
mgnify:CR=1 FL=1